MRQTANQSTRQETSDEAFAAMPKGVAAMVLEAIRERPRSVDELMVDLALSHSTCSSAVNKLMRLGFVFDDGTRSMTRAGRKCIVWHASEQPVVGAPPPTRAELEARIAKAVGALRSGYSAAFVEQILTGR